MTKQISDGKREQAIEFMKAQQEAEQAGNNEFTCPLCGGKAWWSRSSYNNHLHAGCHGCGMRMME